MSTKQTKHPGRRLLMLLLIIVIGFGGLYAGAYTGRTSMTPGLALDLEGGTQIILTPTTSDGSEITDEDVNQAIEIIRQRVDASGVAEAQISRQGGQNIVVSLPGSPSQDTLELVRTSAVLYFRPVIRIIQGSASSLADNYNQRIAQATASPTADDAASEAPAEVEPSGVPAEGEAEQTEQTEAPAEGEAEQTDAPADPTEAPADPAAEATDAPSAEPTPVTAEEVATQVSDANGDGTISEDPLPATSEDNSSDSWISEKMIYDAYMMDCTASDNLTGETQDPAKAVISCDKDGTGQAYILGPADIAGTDIANAASGLETTSQGTTTNKWVVSLEFNAEGTEEFSEVSERLIAYRDKAAAASSGQPNGQSPDSQKAQFAIVLDGLTIMSSGFNPDVTSAITDGRVQITGNFTQAQANTLANQLSFGSLPLSFTVQSEQQVSATLGTEQLRNGLIAGLIGFALIIVYLAWQYRGLSVVAVASLIVAAAGTYLAIALLSWSMGYRLSLAGVAGLIISIGITMDSFIIYFERVRDEVRNGRTLVAAVVLYFLAVGGVQGFAFTLGVTTVVDLAVIILFTHPMMVWILRFAFFGEGHRLSGLDPEHLGARSLAAYGKGREAVIDSAVGSLARRKAEARRRTAAEEEGVSADGAQTDAPDEGIAVDVDSTTGKDGETK